MSDDELDSETLKERYRHTRSFRLFLHGINQNRTLLEYAAVGLEEGHKVPAGLVERIEAGVAGKPFPDEFTPEEKTVVITLSRDDWAFAKWALEHQKVQKSRLHYYLHNVLLAALWGSFESYLQGIIGQIFEINVQELASERQITYREMIEHHTSPIDYLIEREVIDFGHLPLTGMLKYVSSRLKYSFDQSIIATLQDIYFIRNVIAHNGGFVRPSQHALIPTQVPIKSNQIEIPLEYLQAQMTSTESALNKMDTYVIQRWNVPMFRGALFDDAPPLSTPSIDDPDFTNSKDKTTDC